MQNHVHWPSALQLVLSLLAILFSWGGAALLVVLGLAGLVIKGQSIDPNAMFLLAGGSTTSGLLLIPSAWYAYRRVSGNRAETSPAILQKLHIEIWIIAFPVILGLGYLASSLPVAAWLVLPPLHVLAVGLPILWLLWLAVRRLPLGSPQRMWGVFASGLAFGPPLIMIFEGLALVAIIIAGAVVIASQPQLVSELAAISEWMRTASPSQEEVMQRLGPYLIQPAVIFAVLAFGALVVPLIEEAIKPIGVWLLFGKKLTPQAGFAAGALSGAGYALTESLALSSSGVQWASLVVARIGTGIVHILTAGITGWALVQVWHHKRFLRLGLAYLAAVCIHGLWNFFTLYLSFSALAGSQNLDSGIPSYLKLGNIMPYALIGMSIAALTGLVGANLLLSRSTRPEGQPVALAGDKPSEKPEESVL